MKSEKCHVWSATVISQGLSVPEPWTCMSKPDSSSKQLAQGRLIISSSSTHREGEKPPLRKHDPSDELNLHAITTTWLLLHLCSYSKNSIWKDFHWKQTLQIAKEISFITSLLWLRVWVWRNIKIHPYLNKNTCTHHVQQWHRTQIKTFARLTQALCKLSSSSISLTDLFAGGGQFVGVHSQSFEVFSDGLKMDDLTQHGHLLILRPEHVQRVKTETRKDIGIALHSLQNKNLHLFLLRLLSLLLTTTGRSMETKMQKRARSSISAFRTACFSVSSSSRYLSVTSWTALCSWGWMSPLPARHHTFTTQEQPRGVTRVCSSSGSEPRNVYHHMIKKLLTFITINIKLMNKERTFRNISLTQFYKRIM